MALYRFLPSTSMYGKVGCDRALSRTESWSAAAYSVGLHATLFLRETSAYSLDVPSAGKFPVNDQNEDSALRQKRQT